MDRYTHFEGLSNEIFFEIFDYLHALEIFTGFTSLNKRISSILQSIPLRILILYDHSRRQVDFISSHLTFHAHQVISINIYDKIRDYTSIIDLLFHRHNFTNLESCVLVANSSITKLENVIKRIKTLNKLVSFCICAPNDYNISTIDRSDLTRIMLMHKSSVHSIELHYRYDYMDMSNYMLIPSNLISLKLYISGSPSTVSVYSILSILRLCQTIRYLGIIVRQNDQIENNNINVSISTPSINENDLPILPHVISFDLEILARCDSRSIGYILRCMPNLMYFYFLLTIEKAAWPFPGELLDGHVWQEMLERYVPHLSKFEFHMAIAKKYPRLNLDIVVNSFEYFVKKYFNWNITIDRWKFYCRPREEFVMLRTFNYRKHKASLCIGIPIIYGGSFATQSTASNNHHLFYSDIEKLIIFITKKIPIVTWSSARFQQIKYLIVEMPIIRSSLWNTLSNIVKFSEMNDNVFAEQSVTYLSHFVQLSNVSQIEFGSTFDISRWKDVQFILQACPNVINLIIGSRLLVLSKLIDNPSLIPIFKQIKMIESITKKNYFHSNFASKLVQRFPSLIHIELQDLF
ncbi:unnamed protein product [Rotaria sordida]|uniref:F-box domain-containing protein n=1 Tax=Rotaria sordida TaxID=392033 RepID=A0A815JUW7_9BILA|nr:unnamed protein product [Rotaria sordida]